MKMELVAEFLLVYIVCVWNTNAEGEEPTVHMKNHTKDLSRLIKDLERILPTTTTPPETLNNSAGILPPLNQLLQIDQPNVMQRLRGRFQAEQDEIVHRQPEECPQQVYGTILAGHFEHLRHLHKYWERFLHYHDLEMSNCKNSSVSLSKELEEYKMKLQGPSGGSGKQVNSNNSTAGHWSKEVGKPKATARSSKKAFMAPPCEKGATVRSLNRGLSFAITARNSSLVSNCLDFGADPNSTIHLAALVGHSQIVELLLGRGAGVGFQRKNDTWTPLHVAVQYGHLGVVRLLLSKGANTNARRDDKCTPLYQASWSGDVQIAQVLLVYNASTDLKCANGSMPLLAAAKKNHLELAAMLLEHRADVNGRDTNNETALYLAVRSGYEKLVKLLITHKANVDLSRKDGRTALYAACELDHVQIVKALLEAGANTNIVTGPFSQSPLHVSISKGNEEIVKLLISHKADVNLITKYGWTGLHLAAEYNRVKIAKALLKAGANVNIVTAKSSTTPLYVAAMFGNEGMVKLLLRYKANASIPTIYGWTPLHDASELDHRTIAKALVKAGADVNAVNRNNGYTPLHCAALSGHLKMVKFLVSKGADAKRLTIDDNKTPRDVAVAEGHKQIAEYLASVGG